MDPEIFQIFVSEAVSFHDAAFLLGRSFKNIKTSCLRLTYFISNVLFITLRNLFVVHQKVVLNSMHLMMMFEWMC